MYTCSCAFFITVAVRLRRLVSNYNTAIMPLFSGKFSPKKTTPRRIVKSESDISTLVSASNESGKKEVDLEDEIKIILGDQIIRFDNGEWIPETGTVGGAYKENVKLKKRVTKLEEENNMLRIKYEVLLDMLTKTTADFHLQTKEIEQLRTVTENYTKHPIRHTRK